MDSASGWFGVVLETIVLLVPLFMIVTVHVHTFHQELRSATKRRKERQLLDTPCAALAKLESCERKCSSRPSHSQRSVDTQQWTGFT